LLLSTSCTADHPVPSPRALSRLFARGRRCDHGGRLSSGRQWRTIERDARPAWGWKLCARHIVSVAIKYKHGAESITGAPAHRMRADQL